MSLNWKLYFNFIMYYFLYKNGRRMKQKLLVIIY